MKVSKVTLTTKEREEYMDARIKSVDLGVKQVSVSYFEEECVEGQLDVWKVIDVTGLKCGENKRLGEKVFVLYLADKCGPIVQLRTEGFTISFRMTGVDGLMGSKGFQLNASLNDLNPFELATEIIKNSPNYKEALSWQGI